MNNGTNNNTNLFQDLRRERRSILCETFIHPPPVGKQHLSVEYSVLTIKLGARPIKEYEVKH